MGGWSVKNLLKRELELSASGARLAQLLSLGSQLSGLWLQVIPSQARQGMVPAVFRYVLRVYLGLPIPGGWETFGFTHAKSASWLDRQLKHASGVRNRLLREISWVLWRSSGAILERAYRRLCWFHSYQPEFSSAAT